MADPASWDLLNEVFDNLTAWTDDDINGGVSDINPAGQVRLTTTSTSDQAVRTHTAGLGAMPDVFTIEMRFYLDAIGSYDTNGSFIRVPLLYSDGWVLNGIATTDGLEFFDTDAGDMVKAMDLSVGEWYTLRCIFTETAGPDATVDVYRKDETTKVWSLQAANSPCGQVLAGIDGTLILSSYQADATATQAHIDYYKIATGSFHPQTRRIFLIT